MSGSSDVLRAVMDRLVEKAKKKAEVQGKSLFKPVPKPKRVRKCKRKENLN